MIPAPLRELLADLELFQDRQERIDALIDLAQEYREQGGAEVPRDAEHRVPACESEVYVDSQPASEGRRFLFAVDNPQGISAMALARILDQGLSGQPTEQVLQVPEDLVYEIFGRELSMGKTAGLIGMIQRVKAEARR